MNERFMNKKQLQTLIESNVRAVLAEEKRKIVLEQKMNKLIQEAKQLKKQKALLNESILKNKVNLLLVTESIHFHEGIWDSIKKGVKSIFGGGLTAADLEAESEKKIDKMIEEMGSKIDTLNQLLNSKFISGVSRLPDIDDLEELNSATNQVYDSLQKLENSNLKDSDLDKARKKALLSIKTALMRLNSVKAGIRKNLENQREKLTNLVTNAQKQISTKFNAYQAELQKITRAPEPGAPLSFRVLQKAARLRGGAEQPELEPGFENALTTPGISGERVTVKR